MWVPGAAVSHKFVLNDYLQTLGKAITGPVLRMQDIRRPDLRHGGEGGEVHPPRVDGGRGVGGGGGGRA